MYVKKSRAYWWKLEFHGNFIQVSVHSNARKSEIILLLFEIKQQMQKIAQVFQKVFLKNKKFGFINGIINNNSNTKLSFPKA